MMHALLFHGGNNISTLKNSEKKIHKMAYYTPLMIFVL
jgi:hypothetical protein